HRSARRRRMVRGRARARTARSGSGGRAGGDACRGGGALRRRRPGARRGADRRVSATASGPRATGPAASPDVSVIVPTWNGRALLAECLPAIDALAYPRERLEVIVFDNGSRDDTVGWLRAAWPAVRVVASAVNVGFAAACDRAAEVAHGSVLAFLNNDLRVEPQWLRQMTDALPGGGASPAGSRIPHWEGARH